MLLMFLACDDIFTSHSKGIAEEIERRCRQNWLGRCGGEKPVGYVEKEG
jgi:hypothetical protein